MKNLFVKIILLLIVHEVEIVIGAVESAFYDGPSDREDYANTLKLNDHFVDKNYPEDVKTLRKIKEQRFMDALLMEAGRHVLYRMKNHAEPEAEEEKEQNIKIERIKGQPEYINLGMGISPRKETRTENEPCPTECDGYNPVCGNDGKVYDSLCQMRKLNCGLPNVTAADWELCRGKHFLCPSQCLKIYDPVCGEDGHLYPNTCIMQNTNCGRLIDTRPIKYCYNAKKGLKTYGPCPEDCQKVFDPVCGTDGVMYYNECFLEMWTCGKGVTALDKSACAEKPGCPERCIAIYDPVCGSDGNTYFNQCKMLLDNCGLPKDIPSTGSIIARQPTVVWNGNTPCSPRDHSRPFLMKGSD